MKIDPRRLVVLRAVARHGGVVGAASRLHVSPSAVSQQLTLFERELGFALVDRSRRGGQRTVELTAAGMRVLRHADRLVDVLDQAEADLVTLTGAATGPVVIAAFFTVLRGFVGQALSSLALSHPGIEPRIVDWGEGKTIAELEAGTLDIALVDDDSASRRITPKALRYEELVDDPFCIAVPASWPEFQDLSDVARRPWTDGPSDSAISHALQRLRRTTGLPFPAAHSTREFTAALALVDAGIAGAVVPELALAAAPRLTRTRVLSLPGLGSRRLGVMYRRSRNEPTPAVQVVLAAFREAAARQPRPSLALTKESPRRA